MKTAINQFSYSRLEPIWPGDGRTFAAAFAANQTLKRGTMLGQVSSAAASEVQSLSLSGSPTGGTFTLTFGGYTTSPLAYNAAASAVGAALTGGSNPAASVSRTTAGVANGKWAAYASGNSDGTQSPKGILAIDVATDPAGRATYGSLPMGGEHGEKYPSAPVYYKGEFRTAELVGLDANAMSGFARQISGSISDGVISLL